MAQASWPPQAGSHAPAESSRAWKQQREGCLPDGKPERMVPPLHGKPVLMSRHLHGKSALTGLPLHGKPARADLPPDMEPDGLAQPEICQEPELAANLQTCAPAPI